MAPQAVDVRVVQPENWIEGCPKDVAHQAAAADEAVDGVVRHHLEIAGQPAELGGVCAHRQNRPRVAE
jgi:hypothetical protein